MNIKSKLTCHWVPLPGRSYPVWVGFDLCARQSADRVLRPHVGQQVLIVSHAEIAAYYLPALQQACQHIGVAQIDTYLVPAGDAHKTLANAEQIWSYLLAQGHRRDSTLIALGGGMITDLVGFAAGCYQRGVKVIHYATSLLAQVDAAIGGKTAVNSPIAKNMIGIFHQPTAVLNDLGTLATLPDREYRSGLAELIKYGLACDGEFFHWLEKHLPALIHRDPARLMEAVGRAVAIKAKIVVEDERDEGLRWALNFGHTLAHALESLLAYKNILHGEAVAIGMVAAVYLSCEQEMLAKTALDRLISLLQEAGLPTALPWGMTVGAILDKLKYDKKHAYQGQRWILLNSVGEAQVCQTLTLSDITKALLYCGAGIDE